MQEKNACGQDFLEPLAQKLTLDVHAGQPPAGWRCMLDCSFAFAVALHPFLKERSNGAALACRFFRTLSGAGTCFPSSGRAAPSNPSPHQH